MAALVPHFGGRMRFFLSYANECQHSTKTTVAIKCRNRRKCLSEM